MYYTPDVVTRQRRRMPWREGAMCRQLDILFCHCWTQSDSTMTCEESSSLLAAGGLLPFASAVMASALNGAWAWAPRLPTSSIASGTKTWAPPVRCHDGVA